MVTKKQLTETTTPGAESAAEWVALSALKPWAKNPRKNDGKPVRKVVESIKAFGFAAPILARKANGEIIAGHTRFKAAQELGLATVPVRFLDLDEKQAHALALADNRLGEEAEWDDELLSQILLDMGEDDRILTGFDVYEVSKHLREVVETVDPVAEWTGMPECESEDLTAKLSVKVNFASEADMQAFASLVGQTLTEKTKSIWYPAAEIGHYADRAYEDEGGDETAA